MNKIDFLWLDKCFGYELKIICCRIRLSDFANSDPDSTYTCFGSALVFMRIRDPENVHTDSDADPGGCTPKITETKIYNKSLILTIFAILLFKAKFKC